MISSNDINKICVVKLPIPLLESRGSVIRNNFLEYKTNKATHFVRRIDCYALLAINKANHILKAFFAFIY